jgi:Protein of unknown function (DUF4244)
MLRQIFSAVSAVFGRVRETVSEVGQTTAEYALVILGAAAIGTLVITWATKSHTIGKLFDTIIGKILPG